MSYDPNRMLKIIIDLAEEARITTQGDMQEAIEKANALGREITDDQALEYSTTVMLARKAEGYLTGVLDTLRYINSEGEPSEMFVSLLLEAERRYRLEVGG